MSEAEISAVRGTGSERRYASGGLIVRVGDEADCLYFLLEGEADVWVEPTVGLSGGRRMRLTTLSPGTAFGKIGILSGQRRTANVSAATELRCMEVPFAALHDGIRPQMLVNMAGHLAAMLKDRAELMQHLA